MTKSNTILIGELIRGYSQIETPDGEVAYLRHFSVVDFGIIDELTEYYTSVAEKRGVPTEEALLKRLDDDGLWSQEEEQELQDLEERIKTERGLVHKLQLQMYVEAKKAEIEELEEKRDKLFTAKSKLLTQTAERYGSQMAGEEFLQGFIFADRELSTLKYSKEEYGDLSKRDIAVLYQQFQEMNERFSDMEIKRLVLSDEYGLFLRLADFPQSMFAKPFISLSAFQLRLIGNARYFLSIFQNIDDIPENIAKDPEALLDFVEMQRSKNDTGGRQSRHGGKVVPASAGGMVSTDEETDKLLKKARRRKDGPVTMADMVKMIEEGKA